MATFWARITCVLLLVLAGCSRAAPPLPAGTILVLGDSLSAGYGLPAGAAWPALLAARLAQRSPAWRLVNASISGDTSAGGRARLPALLEGERPVLVLIELGANDALRGQPLDATADNLRAMIAAAQAAGARVGLIGMQIPPNFGPIYTRQFHALYEKVAAEAGVPLLDFLLEPIAGDPAMFQDDGIHPTAAAQGPIADHVARWLKAAFGLPALAEDG
ncbi:arylesterase [Immundisolibacter sp.]|uniref:arylesterase n=1 Tax=Immundisolibacter sp. TaxID=1934948 RepID=UPI0026190E9E|nr:arylesterase [Immundisolibacter sp.]MDD3651973.1 arylesterase [Immundisolibacter sp.]